jgi:hypothetical protein
MNESVDREALVMPSSMCSKVAGSLPSAIGPIVLGQQLGALHLLGLDELGVARLDDGHPAQHLANDHFDVLVVDLHTLQAVDVLNFVGNVASQRLDALQAQDVMRIRFAFDDLLALVDHLAIVHQHVLVLGIRNSCCIAVEIRNDQSLLALGVLTKLIVPVTSASTMHPSEYALRTARPPAADRR